MFVYSPIARGVRPLHPRTPLLSTQSRDLPHPVGFVVHDHVAYPKHTLLSVGYSDDGCGQSIFLRACHSSWPWLSQNTLSYIRGSIVVYLAIVMGLLFHLKVENQPNPAAIAFQFSTVSFIMLYLYHLLVFCWTITHFGWENMDDMAGSQWDMRVVRALSPPVQKPHEHKDLYFSLFYTTVHVFSLVSALVFWAVLVPTGHGSLNSLDGVVIWGKRKTPVCGLITD